MSTTELTTLDRAEDPTAQSISSVHRTQAALPPADEGAQAWLCLLGCFMANVLVWGFAFSYGILQEYYSTHEPFASHPEGIPAVGTTATGLSYLSMPFFFWAFRRWPRARRYSVWLSLPMVATSLIGASFAMTVGQLLFCQGILYALAGNALVVPTITYLDEWFIRRKGLAVGLMWAGDGTGGLFMPLLMQALLDRVGFRWTLRAFAGIIFLLTAPMIFFLKPRLPVSGAYASRPLNISFLKTPLFWVLQTFNILEALGYFIPVNYLPSYARSVGLSSTFGSITLLIINLASIFGCVSVGALADRFDITTILLGISTLAGSAILLLWGLSASMASLCIFCIIYGLTAGGYSTSWGGMVKDIQRRHEATDTSMLFGLLAAGRGIGAVISGPLSEGLFNTDALSSGLDSEFAYDGKYKAIIVFSGCTALVGGGSWLFRRAGII